MSTPDAPWTDRLLAGSRRVLLAGVATALVTGGLSFWFARDDGHRVYAVAPEGQPGRLGASTWHLEGLRDVGALPAYGDPRPPVDGATFVVADLRADLTGVAEPARCLLVLQAGDYSFVADAAYDPTEATAATSCAAGVDGVVSAAFEVPTRLLDRVDGVRVVLEGASLVIPGRLGG